ncbi:MAG: rod shape-determining protein RodA [Candidatus Entotheonellia bacterium]
MIDRRMLLNIDWVLVLLVLMIGALGLTTVYSATHGRLETHLDDLYMKQLYWFCGGLVLMILTTLVDYQTLSKAAYPLLALGVLLLLAVWGFGRVASGARRWIFLGPLSFQPSEAVNLFLILSFARYFTLSRPEGTYRLRDLVLPVVMVIIPFVLIVKQPDLGTALVLLLVGITLVFASGFPLKILLTLAGISLAAMPLAWTFLKDYQKIRLITLLNPDFDPLGAGYHSWQSKIAIGSGGFWGKGLFAGTQSGLNFLPEKHTDFIFAVLSEEWGFLGSAGLIVLYMGLILRGISIAYSSKDRLGCLTATGLVSMLGLYIILNIGMTIGITPVVGLPLPLFSYGGSSTLAALVAVGLLLNIRMRRFLYSQGANGGIKM